MSDDLVFPIPIWAIIEPGLEDMEKAWNDARMKEAVVDAIEFCEAWKIPPPQWAVRALREIVPASPGYARDMKHFRRYAAVQEARFRGETWDAAYKEASQKLKGTGSAGNADYMHEVYRDVRKKIRKAKAAYRYYRLIVD